MTPPKIEPMIDAAFPSSDIVNKMQTEKMVQPNPMAAVIHGAAFVGLVGTFRKSLVAIRRIKFTPSPIRTPTRPQTAKIVSMIWSCDCVGLRIVTQIIAPTSRPAAPPNKMGFRLERGVAARTSVASGFARLPAHRVFVHCSPSHVAPQSLQIIVG